MNKKKAVAVISAAGLAGVMAVGGTLAYLTNSQSATNTFTVGKVEVGIDEPNFPGTTDDDKNDDGINDKKKYPDSDGDGIPDINEDQVPQQETDKDPMVTNKSISDAIVFVKVTVPVRTFTHINDDGTTGRTYADELYFFKQGKMATQENPNGQNYVFNYTGPDGTVPTTIKADAVTSHANHWNENWTELEAYEEGTSHDGSYRTYVFGYNTKLHGLKSIQDGTWTGTVAKKGVGETTIPLFQKVQLQNFKSGEISTDEIENITVQTYVIQADNVISDSGVVNTSAKIAKEDLATIYETYVAQNKDLVKNNDTIAGNNAAAGVTSAAALKAE